MSAPIPSPTTPHTPPAAGASAPYGYVLLISLVAALGGFLFGYDTAVVSGAIGFLRARFELTAELTGWAASSLLVGCMVGAAAGGPLGDRFGRKWALAACAVVFMASAVASALANTLSVFAQARFAGGLAIGAASILSPLYIAEVAPRHGRGRLISLYQLAIVLGILAVFFVNLRIQRLGDEAWNVNTGWRWMFATLAAPSLLFALLLLFVPESPRWLVKAGRPEAARRILERINGASAAARELTEIRAGLQEEPGGWGELLAPGPRRALLVGGALAIFQQFSGINAIMYYAPEIFKAAGETTDAAFAQTVTVGAINLVFTLVAIACVDRFGRKPLLLIGSLAQMVTLALVALVFHSGGHGVLLQLGIFGFVASFAAAMGPVAWIVNAEIFSNRVRGRAMAITIGLLWLSCYAVSQTFPILIERFGPATTFAGYAVCSALCAAFIARWVPETKGRSLEEIGRSWEAR